MAQKLAEGCENSEHANEPLYAGIEIEYKIGANFNSRKC